MGLQNAKCRHVLGVVVSLHHDHGSKIWAVAL
jgi:hypothetical protein